MRFFQILMLAVATLSVLCAISQDEKSRHTALFSAAGVLYLTSVVIERII